MLSALVGAGPASAAQPHVTSNATRDCSAQTAAGTVTASDLDPSQTWDLRYGTTTLSSEMGGGANPVTFPFSVSAVPASTTALDLKLIGTGPSLSNAGAAGALVTVTLPACSSPSSYSIGTATETLRPTTSAAHPSGTATSGTAATAGSTTSSPGAGVAAIATSDGAATSATAITSANGVSWTTGTPTVPVASTASRHHSSHGWAAFAVAAVIVFVGAAAAFIVRARRIAR
jgi:hypothetical protein